MRINSKLHAIIDYIFVGFMLASPLMLDLPETASMLSLAIATIHFFFTAATDFEGGILKVIPFRVHGLIEIGMALLFGAIAYWIYDFEGEFAAHFFLGIAVWTIFAFLITDFKSADRPDDFD